MYLFLLLVEARLFTTFEQHSEFLDAQKSLLSLNLFNEPSPDEEQNENLLFQKLSHILDEYQEQSYLLDPFLENLVAPVVEHLKSFARTLVDNPTQTYSDKRLHLLAFLLYSYIKCRGYKTIIRYFPHEVTDLSIALDFVSIPNGPTQDTTQWELRYIVLLWLYLICMIPFDLSQFDDPDSVGRTSETLKALAMGHLEKAGLEREGASLLLSRLYMRKDTGLGFEAFLDWTLQYLKGNPDIFMSIGVLQVLCEAAKSGSAEQVTANIARLLDITNAIDQTSSLTSNTVARKYRTKLLSRIGLRILPAQAVANKRRVRALQGNYDEPSTFVTSDIDIPTEIETILEQLFDTLSDKDTIVRWSASKGVARIAERLPSDFANQVFQTVVGLFSIHSIAAASLYDMPTVAESTWHGACLACAEMARRSLVSSEYLPELIEWLSKALFFDLRRGAHSIGSNVRDAASYVLWALARTQDTTLLVPHANILARRLVAVAVYDREIHIRRAASAAFQEHVGRTSLFPHGIDILGKTDFYAVSVRRNAFLHAAPQVAEHIEYREFLVDHVVNVILRHWDASMRELGSQSLRKICSLDLPNLGVKTAANMARLLESLDTTDIHGALLALSEIAIAYRENIQDPSQLERHLCEMFCYLNRIPGEVLFKPRNELVTSAACRLIESTITLTDIKLEAKSSVPNWRKVVDYGLKHRSSPVQESAARALGAISRLTDCVNDLIKELKGGSSTSQQSLGRLLGLIDYNTHPRCLHKAVECLLDIVKVPSKLNIEVRRICYVSMPQILSNVIPSLSNCLSPEVVRSLFGSLLVGLDDYTIDERGDVGSWIRVVCIKGLALFSELLISNAACLERLEDYLPPHEFHSAIAGILKQGVERLDNVRQVAGDNPDNIGWNECAWLFPRAVRLLQVPEYRKQVLSGIVLSVGSKTDSTQRPMSTSLVSYAETLPILPDDSNPFGLVSLVNDLLDHAKKHITSNSVVIPVFQAFNILLEAESLSRLSEDTSGVASLKALFSVVTKNVGRLKSVQRVHEAMKIVVNLLVMEALFEACVGSLSNFLVHPFPKIRTDTAEYLYLLLQSRDLGFETDSIEDILLETEWTLGNGDVTKSASDIVLLLLEARKS
ncbi:TBCD protein [Cyathus striatus]|nr:TBCD protein [Cyathus striatus]